MDNNPINNLTKKNINLKKININPKKIMSSIALYHCLENNLES